MKNLKCLTTNEVCGNAHKRCKDCVFDDCKKVLQMIDVQENKIRLEQLNKLSKELPKECIKCPYLEVINLERMEVKCFYRVKDRCILH